MRRAGWGLLLLAVAGCSGEAEQPAAAPPQAAPAAVAAAPATAGGSAGAPSAAEARTFILSKLESVQRGNDMMRYHDVSLGPQWTWRETVTTVVADKSAVSATDKSESYTVDPAQIRLPVAVVEENGSASIRIECATADCLSVRGSSRHTFQTVIDAEPTVTETPIAEARSSNFWWFRDRSSADRVAKAMNVLLAAQGARESAF